jgi:hypothetical protein
VGNKESRVIKVTHRINGDMVCVIQSIVDEELVGDSLEVVREGIEKRVNKGRVSSKRVFEIFKGEKEE